MLLKMWLGWLELLFASKQHTHTLSRIAKRERKTDGDRETWLKLLANFQISISIDLWETRPAQISYILASVALTTKT